MNHNKRILLLIRLLPFRSSLSLRLRRHLEQCPECLSRMADIRDARVATVSTRDLGQAEDFWPRLAARLERPLHGEPSKPGVGWAWALGTAGLLALAIIGVFFFAPSPPADVLSSGVKLRVNYVRMYEEPARAFIFRTQDANSTFVWVEKPKPGEAL